MDFFKLYNKKNDSNEFVFDGECVIINLEVGIVLCVFLDVGLISVLFFVEWNGMCLLSIVE